MSLRSSGLRPKAVVPAWVDCSDFNIQQQRC
jgi:hypothetical protein